MKRYLLAAGAALALGGPAFAVTKETDGAAKECQSAIIDYNIAVDELKKAHDNRPLKSLDELNDYLTNLRANAYTAESLSLRSVIHAVDDLHCTNIDEQFTNYLIAEILAARRYANDLERQLTPTFNTATPKANTGTN